MLPVETKRQRQKSTDALQEKGTESVAKSERVGGVGGGGQSGSLKRAEACAA